MRTDIVLQLVLTFTLSAIGLVLFLLLKDSIIISNRQPRLVVIEVLFLLVNITASVIIQEPAVGTKFSCELFHFLSTTTVAISLSLTLARMTFVYNYLMKDSVLKYGLMPICKFLWTENRKLKGSNLFYLIFGLAVISAINIIVFDLITQQTYPELLKCSTIPYIFMVLYTFSLFILFIVFSIQFIRLRIFDQIWMSYEFILFTFTSFIALLSYTIAMGRVDIIAVKILCWIGIFYLLYFPLVAHLRHTLKMRSRMSKTSLVDERVMELCRQFYCEENGLFLESFKKYELGLLTADYLIITFINVNSQFELNIDHALRSSTLTTIGKERDVHLKLIFDEIKLLVQTNVIPYLSK